MTLKLYKANQLVSEHSSWNEACRSQGTCSGMNANACKKYLEKQGFKIEVDGVMLEVGVSATKSATSRPSKPKVSLIEHLIKLTTVIDTAKINELDEERKSLFTANPKTTIEFNKIRTRLVEIQEEIVKLENPEPSLTNILDKVSELYAIYSLEQANKTQIVEVEEAKPEETKPE